MDIRYVEFSSRNHDVSFTKTADDRRFHPVRDYLNGLPAWEGVQRIETLLVRCLQTDDTPYVRAVTRKTFAAAVARIYNPGTKFDSVLVLDGMQGIGKSTLFKYLVGDEHYSETLSLTDMDDKSGAEKLQGFWIVEIGELAGMKKADIEKVKAFLSTSDDKYCPSYGKTVESHPRQCIIIASVNGERGYLRDITGNRRFWGIGVHQEDQIKKWGFSRA
jgi:predicted P-loop ATPase